MPLSCAILFTAGEKMELTFDTATSKDISELVRLRIAYMKDDFGSVSQEEKNGMEKQLPDYFKRKLGTELIVFTARAKKKLLRWHTCT